MSHQDGVDIAARADGELVTTCRAYMPDIVQALHLTYEGGKLISLRASGMLRMAGLLREMVCACESAYVGTGLWCGAYTIVGMSAHEHAVYMLFFPF